MQIITRKEAKVKGLTHYFTGKSCKRGHIAPRQIVSQNCTACVQEWKARDRKSNPEKHRRYRRDDYERRKDEVLAQQKQYRKRNWKTILEKRRNSNAYREYMNKYFREYFKREGPRAKHLARIRKRQMMLRNALTSWFEEEKVQIEQLYEQRAKLTRETGIEHNVDHIVPLQNDVVCGLHCLDNLRIITAKKNGNKSNSFFL